MFWSKKKKNSKLRCCIATDAAAFARANGAWPTLVPAPASFRDAQMKEVKHSKPGDGTRGRRCAPSKTGAGSKQRVMSCRSRRLEPCSFSGRL